MSHDPESARQAATEQATDPQATDPQATPMQSPRNQQPAWNPSRGNQDGASQHGGMQDGAGHDGAGPDGGGSGSPRPEDLEMRPRGRDARGRLFRSNFMEQMTRVSPTVALCTYIPIALVFVVINFVVPFEPNVAIAAALFFGGMLSWTFFEYLVHRFVFHFITESKAIQTFHYYAHGIHHEFPRDHGRLFMPPAIAITVAAFVFGLFYLMMNGWAFMFFPGFVIGYLLYAFLHYSIHRYRPPRGLKFLWRHHLQHHYRCPKHAFGVSSPFWDFLFRTMPPAGPSEDVLSRLPKARTEMKLPTDSKAAGRGADEVSAS